MIKLIVQNLKVRTTKNTRCRPGQFIELQTNKVRKNELRYKPKTHLEHSGRDTRDTRNKGLKREIQNRRTDKERREGLKYAGSDTK